MSETKNEKPYIVQTYRGGRKAWFVEEEHPECYDRYRQISPLYRSEDDAQEFLDAYNKTVAPDPQPASEGADV